MGIGKDVEICILYPFFIFYGINLLVEVKFVTNNVPVAVVSASVRSFWAKWELAF